LERFGDFRGNSLVAEMNGMQRSSANRGTREKKDKTSRQEIHGLQQLAAEVVSEGKRLNGRLGITSHAKNGRAGGKGFTAID
jgi:hypothetical protein